VDFVFMLTRDDQTVEDCLSVLDAVRDLGLTHLGFKDVGVDARILGALNDGIKRAGGISHLEVVSTTPEACLRSARVAADIGVDRLLGGTDVEPILEILAGSRVAYYPFAGRPVGHPTRLGGTPETVAADCRRFAALGCAGVDLLAYRATEADPLALVRAARTATPGQVIAAGSVNSRARIRALHAAGVDAFTIGSAAFDGSFSPRKGLLRSQLVDILAACAPDGR
jgi:phosphoribosylformimino-5-aminoimidazole carboxamide ribonucleotide (ProFAR) isomerase